MASEGDPRVLFVMNLVLSFLFSSVVVGGLAFIGMMDFSWGTVGLVTAGVMILTYLVIMT